MPKAHGSEHSAIWWQEFWCCCPFRRFGNPGMGSAVMAGWCLVLMGILWSQKRKIHPRVFPWVNAAFVFFAVVLIYNAGQIHRARNIWQFMTLADHTPWTPGHTLGLMLGAAAGLVAIKLGKSSPLMNSEEILSGPRLVTMAEAQSKVPLSGKPDEKMLFWGGINLPERCGTEHFAIVGTPGSGKSSSAFS